MKKNRVYLCLQPVYTTVDSQNDLENIDDEQNDILDNASIDDNYEEIQNNAQIETNKLLKNVPQQQSENILASISTQVLLNESGQNIQNRKR